MRAPARVLLVVLLGALACGDGPPPDSGDAGRDEADSVSSADGEPRTQRREAERPVVELREERHPDLGPYLADGDGRTLYLFTADSAAMSRCDGACARAWPPFVGGEGDLSLAGEHLREDLVDAHERDDGQLQVTYGGHPLYYHLDDREPGHVRGHGVRSHGGEWYAVSPEGEPVETEVETNPSSDQGGTSP